MGEVFFNPLDELADYQSLNEDLRREKGPVSVSGCMDSQKVHLMYEAAKDVPWKLVVTYDDSRAREIYDDFKYFRPDVWLYPAKDLLFYSSDIHGNLLTKQRMQVLRQISENKGGVVVTTINGLMDHLLPLEVLEDASLTVKSGEVLDIEKTKERLAALGYERMAQVDGMGQFSVRGGIIDVFPLTEELPVRIELWDDEVDSIRSFDPESQRSIAGRGVHLPGHGDRAGQRAHRGRPCEAGKGVQGPCEGAAGPDAHGAGPPHPLHRG